MIQYPKLSDEIFLIQSSDFLNYDCRELYDICRDVYDQYGTVDRTQVLTRAAKICDDYKVLIIECAKTATAPSMFKDICDSLREYARNARLSNAVSGLLTDGNVTITTLSGLIDKESSRGACDSAALRSNDNLKNYCESLGKPHDLIKTGFSKIDNVITGLERGTFFIIGARPSTGKTAFALNIALNLYKQGRRIMFFSLEMTARMIYNRILSNALGFRYSDIQSERLNEREVAAAKAYLENTKFKDNFLLLDDVYTVENICAKIMEVKPEMAFVDFLQCVSSSGNYNDERQKINHISAELKRVAKRTGCIVVALSQVSRTGENRSERAPRMSDLRESGALEQDADYIIMLYRPFVSDKSGKYDSATTDLIFDKNKFGNTGLLRFSFDGVHQRFATVDNNR